VSFKKMVLVIIAICLLIPNVNAKQLTAVEYIQKIADDAGGDKNSIEVIGDTGLAYDNTDDKNLRYVGSDPNNYVFFNDEYWRIIGIMNNVSDSSGNISPRLKIVRADSIGSYAWDAGKPDINGGCGVNEWSVSSLNKKLNIISNDTENTGLYWQRKGDFSEIGIRNEYKNLISNIVWNTGTMPRDVNNIQYLGFYNYERGEAKKCVPGTGMYEGDCNDDIPRNSTFTGKVGIIYVSDFGYSYEPGENNTRQNCLNKVNTNNCNTWLNRYQNALNPVYSNYSGYTVLNPYYKQDAKYGSSTYPSVYLVTSSKIIDGNGTYNNPYIIKEGNYQVNNNDNKTITAKYKGDYSIDYLIKNYNLVTFGINNNTLNSIDRQKIEGTKKGDLVSTKTIQGPILVAGDFTSRHSEPTFATRNATDISFIKGNLGTNIKTPSQVATNKDYVSFDKMYAQVVNEQKKLVEKTNKKLITSNINITIPGIYMINNTETNTDMSLYKEYNAQKGYRAKKIYIDNYNPNEYYVFNIMSLIENNNYEVYIKASGDSSFKKYNNYAHNSSYTGNIIFNYPNARYINLSFVSGNIIAPKADINLDPYFINNAKSDVYGSIFANSITGINAIINFRPCTMNKKLLNEAGKQYVVEPEDYNDDLYTGDYSLKGLLENYNIVSFGKKAYDSKAKLSQYSGLKNGSVGLFHIAGPFLVNGSMAPTSQTPNCTNYYCSTPNAMRLDKESNLVTESYVGGQLTSFVTKYWKLQSSIPVFGSSNYLYMNNTEANSSSINAIYSLYRSFYGNSDTNSNVSYYYSQDNIIQNGITNEFAEAEKPLINLDRLYDNVVTEQNAINDGQKVKANNGKVHIRIGSNYVIDDINDIDEIVFDDFKDNQGKMTIITIKNSGDINLPKMSSNEDGLITTNDYYDKEKATYQYEMNTFKKDNYYGNIVWNVPNATYIKLAANAPFAGHLIAPKADVETPELHFAGCFIVNSLYAEGNTEAHFYPLTATRMDEVFVDDNGKTQVHTITTNDALGEEASEINTRVIGDYNAYLRDTKPNLIKEIFTNPKTYTFIGIVVLIVALLVGGTKIFKRKKKQHS